MIATKRLYPWLKWGGILCLILMVSACGFRLRGQNVLPPCLHCIKIDSQSPYGDFESTLRRILITLGVNVTRTGQAPVTLHIMSTVLFNDAPTIGGSNQARVYVYYYQVKFELVDANHHILIPPQCITTSKTLIINAGRALESTNQLDILQREMQIEAVHMIINMLNSPLMGR
jgi:LPS-assembly lipoprotein